MVLVSKENRRKIYEYLLTEGVIVVKKDSYLPKHQHLQDVPNLQVMMILKSLKSKGHVQDVFCWQWSYFTVNNKGVAFLVKELGKLYSPNSMVN
jgi:small subunit ribosomal protein S10e